MNSPQIMIKSILLQPCSLLKMINKSKGKKSHPASISCTTTCGVMSRSMLPSSSFG